MLFYHLGMLNHIHVCDPGMAVVNGIHQFLN